MADAHRRNNNRGNNRGNNNYGSNYEEAEPNQNRNRPGNRNWRLRFANSRKVHPIGKNGRSRPVGIRHKTRSRRVLGPNFPDENNVLSMIGKSSHASRVASESAQLHANYKSLDEMLQALEQKPINRRIKNSVRANLQQKFYNLTDPFYKLTAPIPPPAASQQFPVISPQFRMQSPPPPPVIGFGQPQYQYPAYPNGYTPAAGAPNPSAPPAPSAPPGNNDLYS
jgi:hypothetical protein